MSEYAQCPNGHTFAEHSAAYRIEARGREENKLIHGWIVVYCNECGHVFQVNQPPGVRSQ